tara:strand:- start:357 stop:2555 length:2199 start_codon:yes stop_codon:yes gene_type:complete
MKKLLLIFLLFASLLVLFNKEIINLAKSLPSNNYFSMKAQIAKVYIEREFLAIDSLKFHALSMDTMKLIIDQQTISALEEERKNIYKLYRKTGLANIKKHPYYDVFAEYKNYQSPLKIKHFGWNPDHWNSKNKTSYRFKFNGESFFAKKKMNILSPRTRYYQIDYIVNKVYKKIFNGIGISYTPVVLCINNNSKGVYFIEDFFDKYLIAKNKKKDSFIFESGYQGGFTSNGHVLNLDDKYFNINSSPKGKKWDNLSKRIINLFQDDNPNELFSIIDSKKLNAIIGLSFLTQSTHQIADVNIHWYYNPVNNKLEPTIRETHIYEMPKNYSIDQIWEHFYSQLNAPQFDLIKDWIIYQGEDIAKDRVIESSLKSALYIKKYTSTNQYKNFISKLNNEFSYKASKQEIIIQNNISKLISKININNENQFTNDSTIAINEDLIVNEDLIIDENITLIIKSGVTITLQNNANIYIYGKINASANKSNPIKFFGNENSNSAIYINSLAKSRFNHCEFTGLSALNNNLKIPLYKDPWETSSAITLFESKNISFDYCSFSNNRLGDDMINVVSCDTITFNNCYFNNILSDALDSDFSNVVLNNCQFLFIGNDAVDGSYSNLNIKSCYFEKIYDKVISAGEESNVYVMNCKIKDSELALVVKDGSLLVSENIILENNTMDLLAFTKKRGYASPTFKIINCNINNFLIEKDVTNLGKGSYYRTSQSIEDVLYGDKYGKATVK